MNGSDMKRPLVIGNAQKPRCFKNIKSLPVDYHANSSSWMTSFIFYKFIEQWNKDLTIQKRKICLLIDNASPHKIEMDKFSNIKIYFLPKNTTSILQPLDAGIIYSFKSWYKKLLLRKLDDYFNETKRKIHLDILSAINIIAEAWNNVTDSTVQNCFRKSLEEKRQNDTVLQEQDDLCDINVCDDFIFEVPNFDNLLKEENEENNDNNDNMENEDNIIVREKINEKEALKYIDNIREYFSQQENTDQKVFDDIFSMKKIINNNQDKKLIQTKLTNFFKKK